VLRSLDTDNALYEKVAKKILSETLRMKQGETLTIETWNNGLPFAQRLVVEARRRGVIPLMILEDETAYMEGVKVTPTDVLGSMGKHEYGMLAGSDGYVFIPGPPIGAYSPHLSRQEYADSIRYNIPWYEAAEKARLRGARLPYGYVGKEYARLYGKKPEEFVRHMLKAALVDLTAISKTGKAIGQELQDGSDVDLQTAGGKLTFTLKGDLDIEDGVVDDADVAAGSNMTYVPPGYVSKQVDPTSAKGVVTVSRSMTRLGLIEDARLEFEGGKLVGWKSGKGSSRLLTGLVEAVQADKRILSSVTVGINPLMKYEYGQDRIVSGAISLIGFGFNGVIRRGSLTVAGKSLVQKGKLSVSA
jgi:leucyl aminopeptidase (aminopeptidase T)